ncbi:MAG TPA: type VI secretion system baseplate subunit TssF [Thermoanaerobaculia bacterium]|nr:type VI secretion system baseplate subunit TssF [Thermoanaerobaculia bacterium]
MTAPNEDLLRHYLGELTYLREMGEGFAQAYPKVAARLELQPDECPDPHVERLIESFAFLTGRIQRDLDSDFPEIAAELLNVLYPHYLTPVPSMAIARFEVDPEKGQLTTGYEVPKHTRLFAHSEQGDLCRLRTCFPATLWPVEVTEAELEPADPYEFIRGSDGVAHVLRIRLESRTVPFDKLELDRLRLYLHGDPVLVHRLYELLFDTVRRVAVVPVGATAPSYLAPGAVQPVGFGEDEGVIPFPRHAHPAYRLIQEYFSFPEKFHFVDVRGLLGCVSGQAVDLLFLLDREPSWKLPVTPETFQLGCVPVVNLFPRTSEPVRIDHRRLEYRLVADMRREKTTEVHSILSVSGSSNPVDETRRYAPFYSFTHGMATRGQKAFWHARRIASPRGDLGGTEMMLSFRDLDFEPTRPPDETVYAHLLCTNRALAQELPAGGMLQTDEAGLPVKRVVCLKKPTRAIDPPLGGQGLWRLVSHLSLNYLSLDAGEDSLRGLREILGLYCSADTLPARRQIQGINEMSTRKVVRRLGDAAWKGFCRGTEVTLTFDEREYVGSSAFLLASVLSRFLALHSSVNSFTQLVIQRLGREGEWKRWPPMAGAKAVL